MTWLTSGRERFQAGARPKRIPVPRAMAMQKIRTGMLIEMAAS
jgi:hypothetical protein